jgi:hypothetical protein
LTERLDNPFVCVVGPICDQGIGLNAGKEFVGAIKIVSLARREMKTRRIAERVDSSVNFCAQSAS